MKMKLLLIFLFFLSLSFDTFDTLPSLWLWFKVTKPIPLSLLPCHTKNNPSEHESSQTSRAPKIINNVWNCKFSESEKKEKPEKWKFAFDFPSVIETCSEMLFASNSWKIQFPVSSIDFFHNFTTSLYFLSNREDGEKGNKHSLIHLIHFNFRTHSSNGIPPPLFLCGWNTQHFSLSLISIWFERVWTENVIEKVSILPIPWKFIRKSTFYSRISRFSPSPAFLVTFRVKWLPSQKREGNSAIIFHFYFFSNWNPCKICLWVSGVLKCVMDEQIIPLLLFTEKFREVWVKKCFSKFPDLEKRNSSTICPYFIPLFSWVLRLCYFCRKWWKIWYFFWLQFSRLHFLVCNLLVAAKDGEAI